MFVSTSLRNGAVRIVLCATVLSPFGLHQALAGAPLFPNTKIKVTVVHWAPLEGEYRAWDVLGGEFLLARDGTVVLPVVGEVAASTMDSDELAEEIADRLKTATGLVAKPEVTVSVVDHSPIYVLGSVLNPGEYKFTDGVDVLRALAMAGGPLKQDVGRTQDRLRRVASLRQIDAQLLLTQAKIARLDAELDGKMALDVPSNGGNAETLAIYAREQLILSARAQELERQTANLSELRELFKAEITVLDQKGGVTESAIQSVEQQLASVTTLVERGVVIASRQSDMERELNGLRSDRLDQTTATMKAKQNIAETTRNLDGLRDRMKTEVTTNLQTERANLRDTLLRQETEQKLLLELLSDDAGRLSDDPEAVSYIISRAGEGGRQDIHGDPASVLQPGDVVTIKPVDAALGVDQVASTNAIQNLPAAAR